MSLIALSCTSFEEGNNNDFGSQQTQIQREDSDKYIIILGDIQEYTYNDNYYPFLIETMEWIKSEYESAKDIRCILQVGDLTQYNSNSQWKLFKKSEEIVSSFIPYICCSGNHDYKWTERLILNRLDTQFNYYANQDISDITVERFEKNISDNLVVRVELFEFPVYILSLEFGPRDEVLIWANNILLTHPNDRFIILTHEFLNRNGNRISKNSTAELQIRNSTTNSPEDIWNKLIKHNNNIICVICGHNGFCRVLLSENDFGRYIPQILFNLQYQENGGNGLLMLWDFKENDDTVKVNVYNTIENKILEDSLTNFKFRYKY